MPLSRSLSPKERGAIRRCERKGGLFNTYKDVLLLNLLYQTLSKSLDFDKVSRHFYCFLIITFWVSWLRVIL